MKLKNTMQTEKKIYIYIYKGYILYIYFHFMEMSRKGQFFETEISLVVKNPPAM